MSGEFEKILEESLNDPELLAILKEKETSSGKNDKRQSVGEVLKGYPGPQRELDLHGHTGPEAVLELGNFIGRARAQKVRTVRVITGRGLHSENMKSILPEMTERKLGEMRRAGQVLAFRREKTGGSFVVYLAN